MGEPTETFDEMVKRVIRENRGVLDLLAAYDRGEIDEDGNPIVREGQDG